MRTTTGIVVLIATLSIISFVGAQAGEFATSGTFPPSQTVDRIAYVTPKGYIVAVNSDGSEPKRMIPPEGRFAWPTWSPDGRMLAFSGLVTSPDGSHQASLYNYNSFNDQVARLFLGQPGVTSWVAARAPHYMNWSPDSSRLAFIASTRDGLKLYSTNLRVWQEANELLRRGPIWFDWSSNSLEMFAHRGTERLQIDVARAVPVKFDIRDTQLGSRVPQVRPGTNNVTYTTNNSGLSYDLKLSSESGTTTLVAGLPPGATFQWAPNGNVIAVTDPESVEIFRPLGVQVYKHISIFSSTGQHLGIEVEEPVIGFFWSPDSTKLLYASLVPNSNNLRWGLLDLNARESWALADFRPSIDQLVVLQFFDQYSRSHAQWAPTSDSFVFAGLLAGRGRSVSTNLQEVTNIYVVDTSKSPEINVLAEGSLAFWSPR